MDTLAMDWLVAQACVDLPDAAFRRVIQSVETPQCLFALSVERRAQLSLNAARLHRLEQGLADRGHRQRLAEELAQGGSELLSWHCDAYPPLLKEIHDAPALIYYRGDSALLSRPLLAVVGSRRPSRTGAGDAESFARALSDRGMTVVSGLALGIDSAAHRGALAGRGSSVAVLGTGLDVCYPRRNQGLYDALADTGLLLSEFPLGIGPRRHQFPLRNRVISGMSLGVLVVEAAIHSGSLITARHALEQNREVFAIPGSIHNPASRGCNALIRQGAKLVETLADILEEFSGWTGDLSEPQPLQQPLPEDAVFLELGFEPTPVDILAQRATLPTSTILSMLSELELSGWVEQSAGGWKRRR